MPLPAVSQDDGWELLRNEVDLQATLSLRVYG